MKPYLPYRPYRPYLAGAGTDEAGPATPLWSRNLTTLDLGDGDTFGRASVGYHEQPDSNWTPIAADAQRMFGARSVTNFNIQSDNPQAAGWVLYLDAGGTFLADGVSFSAAASNGTQIYRAATPAVGGTANKTFVVSMHAYVDSGTRQIKLKCTNGGVTDYYGPTVTLTTTPQRLSFKQTMGATGTSLNIGFWNVTAGAGIVRFNSVQVEDVTGQTNQVAGEIVPTSGAIATQWFATENASTADANGVVTAVTGAALPGPFGLLMEPLETNFIKQTADYSSATWAAASNGDMVAGATIEGLASGRIKSTVDGAATPVVYQLSLSTIAAGNAYSVEAICKADGYDGIYLRPGEPGTDYGAVFNLATGAVHSAGASVTATLIESLGNGEYRCGVQITTPDATQDIRIGIGPIASATGYQFVSFTSNTTDGVLIREVKQYAGALKPRSSPVPTLTGAASRAIDTLSYTPDELNNETRIVKRLVSDPGTEVIVDIDDWDYAVPAPTVPQFIQRIDVYAPGERPA